MATTMPTTTESISTEAHATASPMRPAPWRVLRNQVETRDTFTLTLEPEDPATRYAFLPGQFNMLYAYGAGEVPISMSGPPGPAKRVIHTIRAVGPVTQTLQRAKRGDTVGLRGPYGTAWPVELARDHDVVLIAGGIGLAPLRPAIHHILAHRSQYGRVVVLFGARTPADLLFARDLETWRGRFDIEVGITVDRAQPGWHGHVGVVTTLLPRAPFDPASTAAFVCGPEIMMLFAARELEQRGVPQGRMWLSMERNMKCGVGLCGHCQFGPTFICKDGPVFRQDRLGPLLAVREL
jgi:NAD(P)H-flavin reductase